jgi:hypothetical protein
MQPQPPQAAIASLDTAEAAWEAMGEPSVRQKNSKVFCCDFPPLLKGEGAKVAQRRMPSLPMRKHLQELKQGLPCFFMRGECSMRTLVLKRTKKRLGRGGIVAVPLPTHAHDHLRLFPCLARGAAGVLAARSR